MHHITHAHGSKGQSGAAYQGCVRAIWFADVCSAKKAVSIDESHCKKKAITVLPFHSGYLMRRNSYQVGFGGLESQMQIHGA